MSDRSGKDRLAAHFSNQAAAYEHIAAPLFEPLARRLVDLASLSEGQRVVDVATGTGLAALMAAGVVGRMGHVLATDLSAGMLEVAREKAARLGLDNISFAVADAEALGLPEASCDVVLCSLGLFLFRQADQALAGIRHVLVPGGRFACSVWGSPEGHEPFAIFFGEYAKYDPKMVAPGMGRPGVLERLLQAAGFDDVQIHRDPGTQVFPEPDAFWQFFSSIGGPAALIGRLSPEDQQSFRNGVLGAVGAKRSPAGCVLRTEIVYATAERQR